MAASKRWTSAVLTQAVFEACFATAPTPRASAWPLRLDARSSLTMTKGTPGAPRSILFSQCLVAPSKATAKDYRRVWVSQRDGALFSTGSTTVDRSFVEALARRALPRLGPRRVVHERVSVDRESLIAFIEAATFGKVSPTRVADVVIGAATNAEQYVRRHLARCRARGIERPVKGLHVLALIDHLPRRFVLTIDWREDPPDVLDGLRMLFASGPGLSRRSVDSSVQLPPGAGREKLVAAVGRRSGVCIVQLRTASDELHFVCVPERARRLVKRWAKATSLPLVVLA